jgi:hypothetical protein
MTEPDRLNDVAASPIDRTVLQGGRAKAYRPLRLPDREAALDAALAAWGRGDFFETHELLEPAWMGTADEAEREFYQGLIKLAAAFVHEARGNRSGVAKNLAGARQRLGGVAEVSPIVQGIDVSALVDRIDELAVGLPEEPLTPPAIDRSAR